ncbi:hypothetical protein RKD49_007922 [Streptomyces glaucescens]
MNPHDPSLVVHLFVALSRPQAVDQLRTFWDALGTVLGMDHTIAALALPKDLPAEFPDGAVAARRDRRGTRQAIVRRRHDALTVSVALDGSPWPDLDRQWEAVTEPTEVIGVARLRTGALPPDRLPVGDLADPDVPVVLEEEPGPDDRAQRLFTVLFTEAATAEAEQWFWSQGREVPPAFARQLLNAAKLRYQLRVYQADAGRRSGLDTAIREALTALLQPDPGAEELEQHRRTLLGLTVGPDGAVQRLTRLREMRRTVAIAADDLAVPDDHELAAWLGLTLEDEIVYAEAVHERARETLASLTLEAERALQSRRERTLAAEADDERRRNSFTLLQSGFLGAILMILAAVQAFGYEASFLAPSLVPALIATLGALALLLATLVLWVLAPPEQKPPAWLGALFAGLLGAALGWLAVASVVEVSTGHPASTTQSWAGAVPGGLAGAALLYRSLREGP